LRSPPSISSASPSRPPRHWRSPPRAAADDVLKLTIGQRGNWDTAIAELGTKAGIFKKHGLALDMIYTSGSGETLQPVISGSVDLGLAVGTLGAIAAYAKGAPVRIVAAQATGAADYWYAKSSAPFSKLADLTEKNTIAYSTNGSSTNSVVRAFIDEFKLKARPVATGNAPSTLTAVMTGQVDVGWASRRFASSLPAAMRWPGARTPSRVSCAPIARPSIICTATTRRRCGIMPAWPASPRRRRSGCATSSSPSRWSIQMKSMASIR
jgi:ABC-type nitrate/sulfonate/bicarbonate transport system substrate-binding protein